MLIGIDVGGTKNELVLCENSGRVINRLLAAGSNASEFGAETASRRVVEQVKELMADCPDAPIDALYAAGCKAEDLLLVFALGSHRSHTGEEQRHLAGERAWNEIRCVDSDPKDCVHLGVTKNGTPVDIFRPVAEADRVICLGNIEYHYFAGYSGGAKAVMPGVSTREAIQANHSRMVRPEACAGGKSYRFIEREYRYEHQVQV